MPSTIFVDFFLLRTTSILPSIQNESPFLTNFLSFLLIIFLLLNGMAKSESLGPTYSYQKFDALFTASNTTLSFYFFREVENVSTAIRAECARGDGRVKRKEDDRRKNIKPSDTLFVVRYLFMFLGALWSVCGCKRALDSYGFIRLL